MADLSFSAGLGVTAGFEAGVSASLEASVGLDASASVGLSASASFGADVSAGFSLSAAAGDSSALSQLHTPRTATPLRPTPHDLPQRLPAAHGPIGLPSPAAP